MQQCFSYHSFEQPHKGLNANWNCLFPCQSISKKHYDKFNLINFRQLICHNHKLSNTKMANLFTDKQKYCVHRVYVSAYAAFIATNIFI